MKADDVSVRPVRSETGENEEKIRSFRVRLPEKLWLALESAARAEHRPPVWQLEVLIKRVLEFEGGLPPYLKKLAPSRAVEQEISLEELNGADGEGGDDS